MRIFRNVSLYIYIYICFQIILKHNHLEGTQNMGNVPLRFKNN